MNTMTFKLKRGLLTPAEEATPEDFIIIDNDCIAGDRGDVAPAVSASGPLEQLEDMERYAQLALQTVSSSAAAPAPPPESTHKGAYVHYIPQFYLH